MRIDIHKLHYMAKKERQWDGFIKDIEIGLKVIDAAVNNRIARETVYAHRRRDKDFADRMDKALLTPKRRAITVVQSAMMRNWQAAAWWLERKHQDEFSLRNVTEHTGKIDIGANEDEIRKLVKKRMEEIARAKKI